MKKRGILLAVIFCALALIAMMSSTAVLAAEVKIKGTISEEGIMADDGQVYEVADNEKGGELLELVDKKVEATGTVEERDGKKVITVTDYQVIE